MTSVMSKGDGYSGDEQRLHVGRSKGWDGMGQFTNQKDPTEPLAEVEGQPTLDRSLMKSLGFRTEFKKSRKLHHGLRPVEFVFRKPKRNRIHCANALRKKGQGAKVIRDIEHAGSNPLSSFNTPPLIPVTLPSLMEFSIDLGNTHFTI